MGQGQRSTLKVTGQKKGFQVSFDCLTGNVQGQGSWVSVKPSLKVVILAGGLTPKSSCIFAPWWRFRNMANFGKEVNFVHIKNAGIKNVQTA